MSRRLLEAAATIVSVAATTAWADHPIGGTGGSGAGIGLGWLFLAGVIVVVGLAAWAMFAPEREEPDDDHR